MMAVALPRADQTTQFTRRFDQEPAPMSDLVDRDAWRARKIRDWLLAILCFAVTLEQADKATVLAIADEMDRSGFRVDNTAFAFFARTSTALCRAIADQDDPQRNVILRRHINRIDDSRIRRALAAAIDLQPTGSL
jgi:hypothetical protein